MDKYTIYIQIVLRIHHVNLFLLMIRYAVIVKVNTMSVSVDSGSLIVDDKEFVVKGFVYSPYLIGQRPGNDFPSEQVVELDFKLMRIVNANTIRIFSDEVKNMPQHVYDIAEKYKLKIIQGIDIVKEDFNLSDDAFLRKYKRRIKNIVERIGDSNALLMWCMGNELSENGDTRKLTLLKKLIFYLRKLDDHPITYSNFGTYNHPFKPDDKLDVISAALYIWGAWNGEAQYAYKQNLENFLDRANEKPLLITELGASTTHVMGWLGKGHGGCSEFDQAEFLIDRWAVIQEYLPTNYFTGRVLQSDDSNFCIGACVFEWSDEYWKNYIGEYGRYSDVEKHFGIVKYNRKPKRSYYALRKIWSQP